MPRHIYIVNFKRYNPPHKALNKAARNGEPLPWVRLQTDWYDDKDIGAMPEAIRWIWPAVFALAGKSRPPGHVDMTVTELAHELRTSSETVTAAIDHLRSRGKIRLGKGGARVAIGHPEGGGEVA